MNVGSTADSTQIVDNIYKYSGKNLHGACLGLSVRWYKLTQTLWSIVVRPSRRSVTKDCFLGYLSTLEWYVDGEINREEYLVLHSEWLQTSNEKNLNRFTLAHLREVLIERGNVQESKLEEWIRLITGEYHNKMLSKPLCYNRSSSKDEPNSSTLSGGSRGKKKYTYSSLNSGVCDRRVAYAMSQNFRSLGSKKKLELGFRGDFVFCKCA